MAENPVPMGIIRHFLNAFAGRLPDSGADCATHSYASDRSPCCCCLCLGAIFDRHPGTIGNSHPWSDSPRLQAKAHFTAHNRSAAYGGAHRHRRTRADTDHRTHTAAYGHRRTRADTDYRTHTTAYGDAHGHRRTRADTDHRTHTAAYGHRPFPLRM